MVGDGRFKENSQLYWYPPNVPFLSFHSVKFPERAAFTWPSFPTFHLLLRPLQYSFHSYYSIDTNFSVVPSGLHAVQSNGPY